MKTTLCNREGTTSIFIAAEILENGDLQLAGQDVGIAPRQTVGDSDYEYWLTVPAVEKDRLLLALLSAVYNDDPTAVTKLRALLDEQGVPHKFHCF